MRYVKMVWFMQCLWQLLYTSGMEWSIVFLTPEPRLGVGGAQG